MQAIIDMIPWSSILILILEYFLGKTDWVKSSSTLELSANLAKKAFKKNHKI